MTGMEMIARERKRQVAKEGYSASHDDNHEDGSLAICAAEVAMIGLGEVMPDDEDSDRWGLVEKHSVGDRKRQLAIAGALIVAELDRLLRHEARMKREAEEALDADRRHFDYLKKSGIKCPCPRCRGTSFELRI